jgi:hypothetical protein
MNAQQTRMHARLQSVHATLIHLRSISVMRKRKLPSGKIQNILVVPDSSWDALCHTTNIVNVWGRRLEKFPPENRVLFLKVEKLLAEFDLAEQG